MTRKISLLAMISSIFLLRLLSFAQGQNVAVINFEALGMAPAEAAALTERFRSELFQTKAFTVLERDRMDAVLQEQGFQQTGCTSNECMVAIGQLLNVRQIFAGSDENASTRVWRSGSYLAGVIYTRCARRAASPPGQKLEWLGFRVARGSTNEVQR